MCPARTLSRAIVQRRFELNHVALDTRDRNALAAIYNRSACCKRNQKHVNKLFGLLTGSSESYAKFALIEIARYRFGAFAVKLHREPRPPVADETGDRTEQKALGSK